MGQLRPSFKVVALVLLAVMALLAGMGVHYIQDRGRELGLAHSSNSSLGVVVLDNASTDGPPSTGSPGSDPVTPTPALAALAAPPLTSVEAFEVAPSASDALPPPAQPQPQLAQAGLTPPYEILWADPTNYGDRYSTDIDGQPVYNQPIIVLHETVYSADSAINFFRTPHPNESDQASYHTLIRLNGTVIYMVPPEKRAYGAGNSVFVGQNGIETVKTHKSYPPSVNNFAYHVSLETPYDGQDDSPSHSGYTEAQYQSLAWLIAQSTVPDDRITTHREVDRSESRMDPRSFDRPKFLTLLHQLRGVS